MKTSLLMGIILCAIVTQPMALANDLPVIIPDSSWPVTKGGPGAYAHTRIRFLDKSAATTTVSEINTPAMIRSAYNLPSVGGAGAIAIVDAYNYPTALSDFNTFAGEYGLPKETSTNATASTNPTFRVVYATGKAPESGGSYIESWNLEEALDIEWAHALAPGAKIYLVEAASSSMSDLLYAVQVASALPGVREVSMSWGGSESSSETSYDHYFASTSVAFFAAGGDSSDDLEYPSASPYVVSVGGTTLNRNSAGALTSETGWNDSGCGISRYEARPAFQNVVSTDVGSHRGANDVAFDANPNTGVMVYDSTPLYGETGWWAVGGTSVGTPSWAGVVNLASVGNGVAAGSQAENARLYDTLDTSENYAAAFRDITSGDDGRVDCTEGWDQPTGLGSPLGLTGK
ncbi:MAG: S53 family peptidase [Methylacidiphilales bacterium]|nr:S53 family peptidase [Candidatus Methylacidiphilales bacterium]